MNFISDPQTWKMDEMDFMDNEYPDLPNATEIDNIVENIEYLLDTEVFMDSVSTFEGSDNNFIPANMSIINQNHSVFNSTNGSVPSYNFNVQEPKPYVNVAPSCPDENNNLNIHSNNVSPRSFTTYTTYTTNNNNILTPRPRSPITIQDITRNITPNITPNLHTTPIYSVSISNGTGNASSNSSDNTSSDSENIETKQIWEKWENMKIQDIINKNLSITQLLHFDLIERLISDQNGSRYLQRLLKKSDYNNNHHNAEVKSMIRFCIKNLDLVELSEDVYGNYIVQLFFMKTHEKEHKLLLDTFINNNFLRLSKSMYGCRVIQKCLSCVTNVDYLCEMVSCFAEQCKNGDDDGDGDDSAAADDINDHDNDKLSQCLVCPYTNHVIQAILDLKLDCKYLHFIKHELEKNLSFYCEHIIGCRIIQCFIKNYGDKLNILKLICNDNHLYLSKLKYGNYVIQCIISEDQWYSNLETMIVFKNKLIEDVFHHQNILYLSKNKFGSNVVEKCIAVSNKKQKVFLLNVLTNNHYIIPSMINHCYGNYVIKALLKESTKKNQLVLIKAIRFYCANNIIKKDLIKDMDRIQLAANNN